MAAKPTPRAKAAADPNLTFFKVDQLYRTVRTAIRVVGVVGCVWLTRDALSSFAGTVTSVTLSVLADMKVGVSIALAGCAAAWGGLERYLRHKKVEQMQGRIKELELKIDPARSSSGLTPAGRTNPKDKLR